jgi:hypothetical protein
MLNAHAIEESYKIFNYCYEFEVENNKSSAYEKERASFLGQFAWKKSPNHSIVLRLFNQINSFYAEREIGNWLDLSMYNVTNKINALLLYRQGKYLGFRKSDISFGVRKHVDRYDPISRYKWFYGIGPDHLTETMEKLSAIIPLADRQIENGLVIYMMLICIHPFADGNGRAARLMFTWLMLYWKMDKCYINEDLDGEFLRIGENIHSTEYIMGSFIKDLCNGFNQVPYLYGDFKTKENEKLAYTALLEKFKILKDGRYFGEIYPSFKLLTANFENTQQIINSSPRFNALKEYL